MARRKRGSILEDHHCIIRVMNGDELQVAFDMTHGPWFQVGLKVMQMVKAEFEDCELDTDELDLLIKLLEENSNRLQ